jgi:hypothetical protein
MKDLQSTNREGKSTKAISVLLLYVLFSNQIISFSSACVMLTNDPAVYIKSSNYQFVDENHVVDENTSEKNEKSLKKLSKVMKTMSGPGQSETSGFSLTSTDDMVDKFTGDFSYSIPLMDVEGYPINLKYNSNVSMNSDASWVGFGWDLNVGSVSREMRGLPDDFNGTDKIERTFNELQDENKNGLKVGGFVGLGYEKKNYFFSAANAQVTALFGRYDNSILGKSKTFDFGLSAQASKTYGKDNLQSISPNASLNYSRDSKRGVGMRYSLGATFGKDGGNQKGASFGSSFNSRSGVSERTFGWSYEGTKLESIDVSTSITYGTATFIPKVNVSSYGDSKSASFKGSVSFGKKNPMFSFGTIVKTFRSTNQLDISGNKIIQPAYGYFHSGKRAQNKSTTEYPVMDFNRTNESAYSEEMKNLPFSIQTFDVFYVSGLDVTSTFRANRYDLGTYYDPTATSEVNGKNSTLIDDNDASAGIHFGDKGIQIKAGYAAGFMPGNLVSGNLVSTSGTNVLEFNAQSQTPINAFDNSIYFKSVGETTPNALTSFNLLNGTSPDCFAMENVLDQEIRLTNKLKAANVVTNPTTINNANLGSIPVPFRATYYKLYTVNDIVNNSVFASPFKNYYDFPEIGTNQSTQTILRYAPSTRKLNHLSLIEVTSTNGNKYTYGVPVYNLKTDEVSFAATGLSESSLYPGLVNYSANNDNSPTKNKRGWTNYYDKTEMPAYAHSFLISQMSTPDYVDRTGDGGSADDIGNYYVFNHSQIYGEGKTYNWRFPVSSAGTSEAMLSKGLLGSELDNMAHYTYGEKEIWYTQSIISKNLVAEFVLEDREDAYSVLDENGGLDFTKPLKMLKKIVLYNLNDRQTNGNNAIPLQTVEFEYDYSLCLNTPTNKNSYNSNQSIKSKSGKLTLKKIRVSSGNSQEGALNAYVFDYSNINPDFKYSDLDAWGNYKANNTSKPNDLYPYAEQTASIANTNSKAYKLVGINNPIGGRIEINYESDTYGYVQNKRAMRYLDVKGMTNIFELISAKNSGTWNVANMYDKFTKDYTIPALLNKFGISSVFQVDFENKLFTTAQTLEYITQNGRFDKDFVPNNVMIFELPAGEVASNLSLTDADKLVKQKYFNNSITGQTGSLDEVYFKLMLNVNSTSNKEFIPCVGKISKDYNDVFGNLLNSNYNDNLKSIGVLPKIGGNDYQYGYVVLDPSNSGDKEKLFDKEGKDVGGFLLHPLQRMAFDYIRQNLPDVIYGSCPGCTPDLHLDNKIAFGGDLYKAMLKSNKYTPSILFGSMMRLYDSDNIKYGGNARVSNIQYFDNWNAISGEYNSSYSWSYFYGTRYTTNGVASYEARGINDENPFYFWDTYINYKKHFPDEEKFTPMPIADALYPTPIVGYEKVTVQFTGVRPMGQSEVSFYTSKDFPTVFKKTDIDNSAKAKRHNFITGKSINLYGFTQGYVVETNDYHGKPKETKLYNKTGQMQARTTYKYRDLAATVQMLDRNSQLSNESVSLEYDIHADSRFISSKTTFTSVGLMLKWTLPSPIPKPGLIFSRTSREEGFYSSTLIKHINRSASVEAIETEHMGSINTARNLVYDKYTGNVIVSSLTDEYNDQLYSINYPSHWYYTNLRDLASVNYGFKTGTLNNGTVTIPNVDLTTIYSIGDVIGIIGQNNPIVIIAVTNNTLQLIDYYGNKIQGSGSITIGIIKSNRYNRLNETMQSVVTKKNPLIGSTFTFPIDNIISSEAITYKDRVNVRCSKYQSLTSSNDDRITNEVRNIINPILYGLLGNLVIDKQFSWQSERTGVSNTGIRFDGIYAGTFYPYYSFNNAITYKSWYKVDQTNHPQYNTLDVDHLQLWRDHGKITVFDEFGKELESKDPIGVFSSVLYGYNDAYAKMPIAQAINASQQDIAFDGFEDYYSMNNNLKISESHFDFKSSILKDSTIAITNNQKHSGLASLKLAPGKTGKTSKLIGIPFNARERCSNIDFDPVLSGQYVVNNCMCIKPFEPTPGEYLVSVWIKEDNAINKLTYSNGAVKVILGGSSITTFLPTGNIIDGWQRLEGTVTIPDNLVTPNNIIEVQLVNNSTTENVYFDDFRMHPLLAGMTTVVYDPKTLLPLATHDGYNFTTFYNYDENYNQVRVRVETTNGIQTVSESEHGSKKSY